MSTGAKVPFTVEWAATARDDLNEIIDYILALEPINALKVNDQIETQANTLSHLPLRGRIVPELKFHGVTNYRELQVNPWRLLYRIEGKKVWILSLLDGRRQLDDLLLERFLRS